MEAGKNDKHATKINHHANEHKQRVESKNIRLERHSGTGHGLKEGPKKGGGGSGNWGSYKDDIEEAKMGL